MIHNFEDSGFLHESAGGYPVSVQIIWNVTWEADGPAGSLGSGSLADATQTFETRQHVREIQALGW